MADGLIHVVRYHDGDNTNSGYYANCDLCEAHYNWVFVKTHPTCLLCIVAMWQWIYCDFARLA